MIAASRPLAFPISVAFWHAPFTVPRVIGFMISILAWLTPSPASADCNRNGDTIVCDAVDFDGFLSDDPGLTFSINPGVTVRNLNTKERRGTCPLSFPAVSLGDNSTVTNSGRILTIGVCGTGIQVGGGSSVINAGLIETDDILAYGIEAGNGSDVFNTGTIRTRSFVAYGFFLDDNAAATNTATGRIETSGTVSAGASGRNNVSVTNAGVIVTTGQGSHGIDLLAEGTVNNSGRIEVSGFQATGIRLNGGIGSITNSGEIVGTSLSPSDAQNPEDGIQVTGDSVTIINSGSIEMSAPLASAIRIEITGPGNGSVSNSGSLSAPNGGVIASAPQGLISLINTGTITSTGPGATTVSLESGFDGSSFLTNRGHITAPLDGAAIESGDGRDEIANSGTIEGHIALGTGDDRATFQSGSLFGSDGASHVLDGGLGNDELVLSGSGSLDIAVRDFEEITKFGQGQWTLPQDISGIARMRIIEGELFVSSGASISSDETQIFSNGVLTLTGQLSGRVENQGVLLASQGAQIFGTLHQTESGVLSAALTVRPTLSGLLTVSGEANVNGRLRIDLADGPFVQDGDSLTFLRAERVTSSVTNVDVSGSAFVSGTVMTESDTIGVQFNRQSFESTAVSANGRAIARALDASLKNAPVGALDFLKAVDRLSLKTASEAFNQLATNTPTALLELDVLAVRSALVTITTIQRREGFKLEHPLLWGQFDQTWGSFNGNIDGRYRHNRQRVTAGVDIPFSTTQAIGFSITATDTSGNADLSNSHIEGTSTLLGARYLAIGESWRGSIGLLFGDLSGATDRMGGLQGTARVRGTVDGRALAVAAMVNRSFNMNPVRIGLESSIQFVDLRKKPFAETGAAEATYSFDRVQEESARASIAVTGRFDLEAISPYVRLGISRELTSARRTITGSLTLLPDAPISFGLQPEERTWIEWALEAPFDIGPDIQISFKANGVLNDKTHGHTASLRASFSF